MSWLPQRKFGAADLMGMNRRNVEMISPRNARCHYVLADDKLATKAAFEKVGVPVAPTLCTFESFSSLGLFGQKIANLDEFVIKPCKGSGGRGILVLKREEDNRFTTPGGKHYDTATAVRHIADIIFGVYSLDKADIAVVEPRLKPARPFSDLYANGLSDIRLIFADETLCASMVRVPTNGSDGRANLHQGAIGLGVDINDGRIYRAWHEGREVTLHPESGIPLLGHVIPGWDTILDISHRAAAALPLKYLGIDMIVDETLGPLILEVNVRPGLEIQNVTGTPLRRRFIEKGVLAADMPKDIK